MASWMILMMLEFSSIPSKILDHIFMLVENGEDKVADRFLQVFNTDGGSVGSGEWLFQQIDWNYLKDSVEFEGFNDWEEDDPSQYIITLENGSNSHDNQVKFKRKSPKVGVITDTKSWDIANYCEVCHLGIKSQFAFITPGKIDGMF